MNLSRNGTKKVSKNWQASSIEAESIEMAGRAMLRVQDFSEERMVKETLDVLRGLKSLDAEKP